MSTNDPIRTPAPLRSSPSMPRPGLVPLTVLSFLSLALLAAPRARAQDNTELSLFAGYRFSDSYSVYDYRDSDVVAIALDVPLGFETQLEIYASLQETSVIDRRQPSGQRELFDLDMEYYQVGVRRVFDDDRVRPFVVGTVGIVRMSPEPRDLSSETRFAFTMGGGVQLMLGEHLAFRLEGRALGAFLGAGGGIFCGSFGCGVTAGAEVTVQVEGLAGLSLVF